MHAWNTASSPKTRGRRNARSSAYDAEEVYLAGHYVTAGIYQQVGHQRTVRLEKDGILPATCDGRVAIYVRRAGLRAAAPGRA